jgi:hypothetical protein
MIIKPLMVIFSADVTSVMVGMKELKRLAVMLHKPIVASRIESDTAGTREFKGRFLVMDGRVVYFVAGEQVGAKAS